MIVGGRLIYGCYLLLLLCLTACGSAGGEAPDALLLPGTEDIAASADQNFALSPDGNWLSYTSSLGNAFEPQVVIYDLRSSRRHVVAATADAADLAAQGFGPLLHGGCWSNDSRALALPGDVALFEVAPIGPGAELSGRRADAASQARALQCQQGGARAADAVRAEQRGPQDVALVRVDAPHDEVARFSGSNPTTTNVEIRFLTTSPDGRHIAYVVAERQGSFVVSRGYLHDIAAPDGQRLIAQPVFGPLRFSYDGSRLYGFTETRAGRGIYQWMIRP